MLSTLQEQFGDRYICSKKRSIKALLSEFGVEELDWSDVNLMEHLWNELETLLILMDGHPRRADAVVASKGLAINILKPMM